MGTNYVLYLASGGSMLYDFLIHLHRIHPNITFAMAMEQNGCLLFWDV